MVVDVCCGNKVDSVGFRGSSTASSTSILISCLFGDSWVFTGAGWGASDGSGAGADLEVVAGVVVGGTV